MGRLKEEGPSSDPATAPSHSSHKHSNPPPQGGKYQQMLIRFTLGARANIPALVGESLEKLSSAGDNLGEAGRNAATCLSRRRLSRGCVAMATSVVKPKHPASHTGVAIPEVITCGRESLSHVSFDTDGLLLHR